jgi:hypothetical protein
MGLIAKAVLSVVVSPTTEQGRGKLRLGEEGEGAAVGR